MKMVMQSLAWVALGSFLFLQSCSLADLRTEKLEETGPTPAEQQKGKELLEEAWKVHGQDKLSSFETYEVIAQDHWKGLLGSFGNVWPVNQTDMRLRFAVGSFDSQVKIIEGKKEGWMAGLQSWKYYEGKTEAAIEFKNKPDDRVKFGLSAYQYFFELADRLRKAPIITFAGEHTFKDNSYDIVFVSWETTEPHQGHDQYRLWINKNSKVIEYTEYTVRENYLPGAKHLYGSIHFTDYRDIDGVKIPFKQAVFLNAPSENDNKYVHQLSIQSFKFDAFEKEKLYLNPDLDPIGDAKLTAIQ